MFDSNTTVLFQESFLTASAILTPSVGVTYVLGQQNVTHAKKEGQKSTVLAKTLIVIYKW